MLLDRIGAEGRLQSDLRLLGVVSGGLLAEDGGVREKVLQLIQKNPALLANGEIENTREIAPHRERPAIGIARSPGRCWRREADRGRGDDTADRLDLAFFRAKVLPIFNRMGEDGQNCMGCHRSHTVLRMVPPGKEGDWTPEAVRANYRSALRVVDLARPAESLLLGKPTWEAAEEAEAQNDPTRKAHAGGVRFEPNSREYQTLLDWINGARLPGAAKSAAR